MKTPHRWVVLVAVALVGAAALMLLVLRAQHEARALWEQEVHRSTSRLQQFTLNWVEHRRQLLRSLGLLSQAQGWPDEAAFLADLKALSQDTDGDIALAAVALKGAAGQAWQRLASQNVTPDQWAELARRAAPPERRLGGLAPLTDGSVPLALPQGADQWVVLLLDVGGMLRQLQSVDWPAGVLLQLDWLDAQGVAHAVSGETQTGSLLSYTELEPAPGGQWRFRWSIKTDVRSGPNQGLALAIAVLGGLLVLGAVLLLDRAFRLRESNRALAGLNRQLDARVVERTESLQLANDGLQKAMHHLAEAEKLAALGRLVAGVSHELNTPLGVVTTAASSLQDRVGSLQSQVQEGGGTLRRSQLLEELQTVRDLADLTLRNAARAANLVEHFKEMAVDQSSLRRRRFDVAQVIQAVLQALATGLRRANCELQIEQSGDPELDGYPGAVEQVLTNLVQNCLVHGFSGRTAGRIRVGFESVEAWVTLWVEDDGVGMDATAQARYFEPFFTTRLGQGGSGLGGYLIYNLVTGLLGGEVSVRSTLGEGTRVTVRLPRVAPVPRNNLHEAYAVPPPAFNAPTPPPRP
ncbi:sensor histidine kinase [Inhella gelatinilytica]|uniref:histidine kinase n=1 Tax=Inhella gelatinilytica TaxID=2795030 RepID=A0A931IWC4_9BURK|nr:HAMP domain-containing sensor histidine kinase [Inhella gelatinilytica]MBH9552210.1 HAMP domain-containing histidine kinase [Inhella gelatinilytica]